MSLSFCRGCWLRQHGLAFSPTACSNRPATLDVMQAPFSLAHSSLITAHAAEMRVVAFL